MDTIKLKDHHGTYYLRRLQQQSQSQGGGGDLFLESLIFFAIMIAIFIAVWIVTRIACLIMARVAGSHAISSNSATPWGRGNQDSMRWTEQEMREIRNRAGTPSGARVQSIGNGASFVVSFDGSRVSPEEQEATRRTFLEHALLDHSFESAPYKPANTTETDEPMACPICLDEFQKIDRISCSFNRRCHHIFHHGCILDWLMHDDTCPCCRQCFLEFNDDELETGDVQTKVAQSNVNGLDDGTYHADEEQGTLNAGFGDNISTPNTNDRHRGSLHAPETSVEEDLDSAAYDRTGDVDVEHEQANDR